MQNKQATIDLCEQIIEQNGSCADVLDCINCPCHQKLEYGYNCLAVNISGPTKAKVYKFTLEKAKQRLFEICFEDKVFK